MKKKKQKYRESFWLCGHGLSGAKVNRQLCKTMKDI